MKRPSALAALLALTLVAPPACADDDGQEETRLRDEVSRTLPPALHVSSGDALWNVAERIRPDAASVEQVMLALVEANPEAFPSGNINEMNADAELRVPAVERMLSRSQPQAAQTIDYMNIAWRIRGPEGPVRVPLEPTDDTAPPGKEAPKQEPNANRESKLALRAGDAASGALDADAVAQAARLGRLKGQTEREAMRARLERAVAQRNRLRDEAARLKTEMTRLTEEMALQEVELARREVRDGAASGVDSDQTVAGEDGPIAPASELAVARRGMLSLAAEHRWLLAAGALLLLVLLLGWRYRRRAAPEPPPSLHEGEARDGEKVAFTPSSEDNTRSFPE